MFSKLRLQRLGRVLEETPLHAQSGGLATATLVTRWAQESGGEGWEIGRRFGSRLGEVAGEEKYVVLR